MTASLPSSKTWQQTSDYKVKEMASLKEIKNRIASIRNTQKITSAMRMVASAKLHHVQGMTEAFLRYKDNLQSLVDDLNVDIPCPEVFPQEPSTLAPQPSTLNSLLSTLLIPISSNSGLCGAFNSNIAKATIQRIHEIEAQGQQVRLLPIGKKIAHELKKAQRDYIPDFITLSDQIEKGGTFSDVSDLVTFVQQLYQNKEIGEVLFLYHHFKSMGTQVIQVEKMNLNPNVNANHSTLSSKLSTLNPNSSTFLTEPSPQELLTSLYPRLLNAQAYSVLLDSLTSEHAARMMAMQTADDNANDLLKELTLLYNKTRQQAITNELIDIMSGKGAVT